MYRVGRCLLLDLLKSRNISQTELAERIGTTKQQISSYVRDKRVMSLQTAYNISIVLECEIEDLYKWQ